MCCGHKLEWKVVFVRIYKRQLLDLAAGMGVMRINLLLIKPMGKIKPPSATLDFFVAWLTHCQKPDLFAVKYITLETQHNEQSLLLSCVHFSA